MASIVALRNALVSVALEGGEASHAQARNNLILISILGAASFLMVALIVLFIRSRVVRPLLAATDTLVQVAKGDVQVAIAAAERTDEIGDMSKAMIKLRNYMLDRQRLERELAEREAFTRTLMESSPSGLIVGTRAGETGGSPPNGPKCSAIPRRI
jgi:HAMP domain-containing protein